MHACKCHLAGNKTKAIHPEGHGFLQKNEYYVHEDLGTMCFKKNTVKCNSAAKLFLCLLSAQLVCIPLDMVDMVLVDKMLGTLIGPLAMPTIACDCEHPRQLPLT